MNNEKELIKCTSQILTLAEEVYKELGSGFKEDTLQQALAISFRKAGIKYLRETHLEIFYKKESLGLFRLDFLIPALEEYPLSIGIFICSPKLFPLFKCFFML